MQSLYFVRNANEYREIWIRKDGSYSIRSMTGSFCPKIHRDGFTKYYHHMIANGWRKCSLSEYLKAKFSHVA